MKNNEKDLSEILNYTIEFEGPDKIINSWVDYYLNARIRDNMGLDFNRKLYKANEKKYKNWKKRCNLA